MSFFQLKTLRHVCLSLLLCNIISKFNKLMGCILATFMFKAMYHYAVNTQCSAIGFNWKKLHLWKMIHGFEHMVIANTWSATKYSNLVEVITFLTKKLTEETHFEHFALFCQKNIQKISQKSFKKSVKKFVQKIYPKICPQNLSKFSFWHSVTRKVAIFENAALSFFYNNYKIDKISRRIQLCTK